MADFEKALKKTLTNEGGYVFDIDDPGGETYQGVSNRAHGDWPGWAIIDKTKDDPDFPIILGENKELDDKISELYRVEYWDKIKGDDMRSQGVANAIFDASVVNGVVEASKLAQTAVGAEQDGIIGAKTLKNLDNMLAVDFIMNFMLLSIKRYHEIATDRRQSRKYFFGWTRRVFTYI